MKYSMEYCAYRYLDIWISKEEKHFIKLQKPSGENIRKGMAYFNISRSFRGIAKVSVRNNLVKIFKANCDSKYQSHIERVHALGHALGENFEYKKTISAASKLLWLRYRSPYLIYDSRAVKGLKIIGYKFEAGNYAEYYLAWQKEYAKNKALIQTAALSLPSIIKYTCASHLKNEEIHNICKEEWFHERVFDQYLWLMGEK